MKHQKELVAIQSKLINTALLGAIILIIPTIITSMARMLEIGWHPIFTVHISLGIVIIFLYLFRKKIPFEIRVHGLLILAMVTSLIGILNFRVAGGGNYMSVAVVLAALFFGARSGLIYFGVYFAGFVIIFILHKTGIIVPVVDFNSYLNNTTTWLANFIGHIYVGLVLIYTANLFYRYFSQSVTDLIAKRDELQQMIYRLKFSEDRFRTFMENYPFPISLKNKDMRYVFVNKALADITGRRKDELLQIHQKEIFPANIYEPLVESDDRIFEKKEYVEFDLEEEIPEKEKVYYKIIKFPVNDLDGNTLIGSIAINLTEKRKAEEQLEISEHKFRMLFEESRDGFLFLDSEMRILECNQSLCELLAYQPEELQALNYRDLCASCGDFQEVDFMKEAPAVGSGSSGIFEREFRQKTGTAVPVELNIHWLEISNSTYYWAVIRSIAERKQLEHERYRIQVEAEEKERERYARELHDGLGPLLSTCKIYFHTLEKLKDDKKRSEHIQRSGQLLDEAMQSIKELSNNLSPDLLRKYGLKQALESFAEKVSVVSDIQIGIETDIDERLSETNEFTIYRLLVELINNSLKHSEASTINIKMVKEDQQIKVHYSDNGKGFDYKKALQKRSGFGLFNLENRIKQLGGKYQYTSSIGKGVQVNFSLKRKSA